MITSMCPTRPTSQRRHFLTLLGRLQEAEDDHDRDRRNHFAGVTDERLGMEKARWSSVGGAMAALAVQICDACAASAFAEGRPRADQVAQRLSEAIDDQLDAPAWRLIDAAARLAVAPP
jgi:hypothetical protein